jgi:hypothetical protein
MILSRLAVASVQFKSLYFKVIIIKNRLKVCARALWPLYLYSVALRMGPNVDIGETSTLTPFLDVNRVRADFNQRMFIEGSLFTSQSVIITLILLAPIIYRRFKNTHDE